MEINKSQIKDWLLNGWEHDVIDPSSSLDNVVELLTQDVPNNSALKEKVSRMVNAWVDNEDNCRISIEMSLNPFVIEEKVEEFINKHLK